MDRREKCDRHRGSLLMAEIAGLAGDQIGANHDMGGEGSRGHRNHLISWVPIGHLGADPGDDAGAFTAKHRPTGRQAGVEIECLHHVTEVEPGGVDGDLHLTRPDRAWMEEPVPEVLDAGGGSRLEPGWQLVACGPAGVGILVRHKPPHPAVTIPQQHLVFGIVTVQFLHQSCQGGGIGGGRDIDQAGS